MEWLLMTLIFVGGLVIGAIIKDTTNRQHNRWLLDTIFEQANNIRRTKNYLEVQKIGTAKKALRILNGGE